MTSIAFTSPWFFLLLPTALILGWLSYRRQGTILFSDLSLLPSGASWRSRLAWLPNFFLALSLFSMIVALAGPWRPAGKKQISKEGISIVMVLDTSMSMAALDLDQSQKLSRLDVVKNVFADFVQGNDNLPGRYSDEIGLVTFASFADTQSPVSLDHRSLLEVADSIQITEDRNESGTNIAAGIDVGVVRLEKAQGKSKVLILLTDGVHNEPSASPSDAAAFAKKNNIRIYTIGAGTNGLAPFPMKDPFTGETIVRPVQVEIDEKLLTEIAEETGGKYFRATDERSLRDIYKQIDTLERVELTGSESIPKDHLFIYPLMLGLVFFTFCWGLASTVFRRLP